VKWADLDRCGDFKMIDGTTMANRARLVERNLPHTAPVAGGAQEAAVRRDIEV
jgi:hypothetical protein